jgi:hypothetical protein
VLGQRVDQLPELLGPYVDVDLPLLALLNLLHQLEAARMVTNAHNRELL